jgi:hypothetical protein
MKLISAETKTMGAAVMPVSSGVGRESIHAISNPKRTTIAKALINF